MHSDDLFKDQAKTISSIVLAAETEDELGTVLRIHWVLEELLDVFLSSKTQGDVAKIVKIPRDLVRNYRCLRLLACPYHRL